ncbi:MULTISPECIES: arylesterase [Psychrobacter]|uniref:arylesterase n=1 Tax=Psychrobacter TaxID=497 RepID=UPI000EC334F5|nr:MULTISPECIES: arylesterase [Psychrobacter]HCN16772.1 arylesterase [Psychrobacter sp.]
MMNVSSRLAHCLPAVAILAVVLGISGCQQDPEPSMTDDNPKTISQTASSQTSETLSETKQTTPAAEEQPSQVTILALGDSLTEGLGVASDANYPAQLEASLQERGYKNAKVINSGLSGETSTGLVNRLDWVLQTKPDVTILTIGANDAMRGIDVATIEANIRTAVQRLQDNGSTVILGGMQIYDNLGSDYVQSFAAIYPRVAKDMNVTLIPFFLDGVGGDPKLNQADAIHPTKEGYAVIVNDNILPVLAPTLEKLKPADANGSVNASEPAAKNTPTETM